MGRRPSTDATSTLTPLMFQILLALSRGERHGYSIMQEIEERTDGEFAIGAGSLYRSLKQLLEAGFVEEAEHVMEAGGGGSGQRRYYRITPAGRRRAVSDARVFRSFVEWADEARLLDG